MRHRLNLRYRMKWLLSKIHWLPDSTFLRLAYRLETGRRLELKNPITFNDKLNWLKLYGGTDRYAPLVDKLSARDFAGEVIGHEHLIPLLGHYERPEQIKWDKLPRQYAVKCTHGSHCGIVVTGNGIMDREAIAAQLHKWLNSNWYWYGREPPYKWIRPRIMIEARVEEHGDMPPTDYKFMCFGGEPKLVQVHRKNGEHATIDFFTVSGERLDMRKKGFPNSGIPIDRKKLGDMLPLARALAGAADAPYMRADLYHDGGQVYFSELTFFDSAGFREFEPAEVNVTLGAMLDLGIETARSSDHNWFIANRSGALRV